MALDRDVTLWRERHHERRVNNVGTRGNISRGFRLRGTQKLVLHRSTTPDSQRASRSSTHKYTITRCCNSAALSDSLCLARLVSSRTSAGTTSSCPRVVAMLWTALDGPPFSKKRNPISLIAARSSCGTVPHRTAPRRPSRKNNAR